MPNSGDAGAEAKALFALMEAAGETPEMIRALICITPAEERALYKIEQKMTAERAIRYRAAVLREFDRLLTRDLKADGRRCP